MFPFGSTYIDTSFARPIDMIDPKKKNENWHKQMAEFMYSYFMRDCGLVYASKFSEMVLNELYSEGNQPVSKYMDAFSTQDSEGGREGYYNLPFDILAVLPKFKRVFMEMIHEELKANATCIDEKSSSKKQYLKNKLWAKSKLRPYLEALQRVQPGMELTLMDGFIPENMEELEMFDKVGGIKLPEEIATEKLIEYSNKCGNMPEIQRLAESSFFDHGATVIRDVMDPNTQKIIPQFIDYKYYITERTQFHTNEKSDFDGHIEFYNPANLRNATKGQISDEDFFRICMLYNQASATTTYNNQDPEYFRDAIYNNFNHLRIPVIHCEFNSIDLQVYEQKKSDRHNEVYLYEKDFDYKADSDKRKSLTCSLKVRRRVSWIIGTNHCFDWGVQNDIPRPEEGECRSTYHLYKITNKSMAACAIPNVDQIQNAWNRLNNAISMSAPSGVAINLSAIQGMQLGGKDVTELEILEIRNATGNLLYKATTHYNGAPIGGPVGAGIMQELKGGMGPYGQEQMGIIEFNLGLLRDIIGIAGSADPTANNADEPVKTSQQQFSQTVQSMALYKHGFRMILNSIAKNMSLRYKIASKYSSWEEYDSVIGETQGQIIRLSSDMSSQDMGIFFEARPDGQQRQRILAMAQEAMKNGLSMSDYFFIERCLETTVGIKYAQVYLSYREQQMQQRAEQSKQNDIMANGKVQQKSAMVTSKLKQQEMITQHIIDKEEIDRKGAWELLKQFAAADLGRSQAFLDAGLGMMAGMFEDFKIDEVTGTGGGTSSPTTDQPPGPQPLPEQQQPVAQEEMVPEAEGAMA